MKISLGTAQLGLPYGITNSHGQISLDNSRLLLDFALKNKINFIDTAISYGDCEQRLGQIGIKKWDVITKLPKIPEDCKNMSEWVFDQIKSSLKKLDIKQLYGVLLHSPEQLLNKQGALLFKILENLKSDGLCKKIGISIYNPSELDDLMGLFKIDLIQTPFSILDRRIYDSGWLNKLSDKGVEIHARSVFLQGLLLISKEEIPEKFSDWSFLWNDWEAWLNENNLPALDACLSFVNSFSQISKIIVGVNSLEQLSKILNSSFHTKLPKFPESFYIDDDNLLNPSKWTI